MNSGSVSGIGAPGVKEVFTWILGDLASMPVVYYSQLMTVAHGGSLKQAGLDGHVIQPAKLKQIASQQK